MAVLRGVSGAVWREASGALLREAGVMRNLWCGPESKINPLRSNSLDKSTSDDVTCCPHCHDCRDTLYLFQSGACSATKVYVWKEKEIKTFNIDTGYGVIPSWLNTRSHWGQDYGGDDQFYKLAQRLSIKPPVFVPVITTVYTGMGGTGRRC